MNTLVLPFTPDFLSGPVAVLCLFVWIYRFRLILVSWIHLSTSEHKAQVPFVWGRPLRVSTNLSLPQTHFPVHTIVPTSLTQHQREITCYLSQILASPYLMGPVFRLILFSCQICPPSLISLWTVKTTSRKYAWIFSPGFPSLRFWCCKQVFQFPLKFLWQQQIQQ